MSSKSWIIWSAMLAGPGLLGLWMVHVQNAEQAALITRCRQRVSEGTSEYLASYQQWSRLSAEEKADNSWGQGKYGGPEIQRAISADQQDRLQAYIAELADGQTAPHELSNIMYGPNWRQKVEQYCRDNERRETIWLVSSVMAGVGALVGISVIAVWGAKKIFPRVWKKVSGLKQNNNDMASGGGEANCERPAKSEPAVFHKALFEQVCREPQEPEEPQEQQQHRSASGGYFEAFSKKQAWPKQSTAEADDEAAVLGEDSALAVQERDELSASQPSVWGGIEETSATTMMTNEPVLNSLSELTEEVSAIRQFAAQQQDQMRKLQDGYDWMLIRRFCLRIIRCIDNLCDRIEGLTEQDRKVSLLRDVHDELVFALESSGVEQYRPDVGIPYKGLEKYAEAVKQRQANDQPEQSGHIASVVRPGYQYLVNEEVIKIVR